jgi:hypothetical protein
MKHGPSRTAASAAVAAATGSAAAVAAADRVVAAVAGGVPEVDGASHAGEKLTTSPKNEPGPAAQKAPTPVSVFLQT